MLFIEMLKQNGTIKFDSDFCRAIEMSKQHLYAIKNNENKHFTAEHIRMAVKEFKLNANWVFGFSDRIFINHAFDPRLAEAESDKKQTLIK